MNRRQLLVMLSVSSVGAFAGCIDDANNVSGSSVHPDDMDVSTLHIVENVISLEFSGRESKHFDGKEEDSTTISSNETAEEAFIDDEDTQEFVNETDFSESYLLIVQNGMQSQMELILDSIEWAGDELDVSISMEGPDRVNDDLATHSLLIRITDEVKEIPEAINLDIEGYR